MAKSNIKAAVKSDDSPTLRPIVLQVLGMALMISGVLLIAIPLISNVLDKDEPENTEIEFLLEEEGSIASGASTFRVNAATLGAKDKSAENIAKIEATGLWIATDYMPGDIGVGSYQVKLGDTLWEISEAVYGDGNEWHKILERNSSKIGYLPNGSQALIEVGQVLVIAK